MKRSDDRTSVRHPPLRLSRGASVTIAGADEVHCALGRRVFTLSGAPAALVRAVLSAIDGQSAFDDVARRISGHPPAQVRDVLAALVRVGVVVPAEGDAPEPTRRVVVIGNGGLSEALGGALWRAGYKASTRVDVEGFASIEAEAFRERVLFAPPHAASSPAERTLTGVTVADLSALLSEFDVAVCALEGVPYEALLQVNRATLESKVPCLFVTSLAVGPLVAAGSGPCFACWLLAQFGPAESVPFLSPPAVAGDAAELAAAAVERLGATGPSCTVLRLEAGARRPETLLAHGACPACSATAERPLADTAATIVEIARTWPISPEAQPARAPDAYRTVCIVGGGTAGYLAALALRRRRPELEVTLVESSKIPVIGVGEATTPELVKFLHSPRFLDKDVLDLHRRVRPTLKLGIQFMWGPRDFPFPFQRGRILESKLYAGDLDHQSFGAMLMKSQRSPVLRDERGEMTSLAHVVRWAYHLENRRFVRYLHEEADNAGIRHVDAQVRATERTADGERIAALVLDDGRKLEADLYVDCTGFRALLLEGALGSPFVDWGSTLFTDRAVVATVPHDGTIKPYTLAETMDAGWCWNIPFEEEDHRGYVFSSAFLTPEAAEAEMRAKNPGMGDASLVRFRSGRHRHFWKGNVVALGNAYGFVEPLESTALHMLVLTLELLTTYFPASRRDRTTIERLDRKVGARWDALRWFLGTHYRFNRRLETPFWRSANAESDISGATERVAVFQEHAPLSYRPSLFYTVHPPEFFSDDHSFDTLLMGQEVPARLAEPTIDRPTWSRRLAELEGACRQALPQAEALAWLRGDGANALQELKSAPESWLHTWIPA